MTSTHLLTRPMAMLVSLALSCGACVAAEPAEKQVAATPTTSQDSAAFQRKGKIAFLLCRSCHTVEEGGDHLTGPNLHGVFGAKAGKKDGYVFSDALQSTDLVWNRDSLSEWLLNPAKSIPGNKMAFVGISDDEDRAALISYLETITQ